LEGDESAKFKKWLLDEDLAKLAQEDPQSAGETLMEDGFTQEGATLVLKMVLQNAIRLDYQAVAQEQFQRLAGNRQKLDGGGYYVSVDTDKSPTERDRAVNGLVDNLNNAYRALEAARGEKSPEGSDAYRGGSINEAIYQIVKSKTGGSAALNEVETGFAAVRDEKGRLVAVNRVMVFNEELWRLHSVLDSLHTTFETKSNKADRQDVSGILEDLQRAVASQAAGQPIEEGTDLSRVIEFDFPLKTQALEISAKQIAVMTTPSFENWLESLATARDRAKSLLGRKSALNWTMLNNADGDEYTFLALSDLP
jgi:hypothetical protein